MVLDYGGERTCLTLIMIYRSLSKQIIKEMYVKVVIRKINVFF